MSSEYWFVVHDLESFRQHPNLIGSGVKEPGVPEPSTAPYRTTTSGIQLQRLACLLLFVKTVGTAQQQLLKLRFQKSLCTAGPRLPNKDLTVSHVP